MTTRTTTHASSIAVVYCLVLAAVVTRTATGQRPYYAGSRPIGYPEVADRFLTDEQRVQQQNNGGAVGNRFGQGGGGVSGGSTPRIPVDANGDYDLINRISQWPIEHQPYWFINWQHIEASRNKQINGQNALQQPNVNSRSTFASRRP